jgi:hypothetical protein
MSASTGGRGFAVGISRPRPEVHPFRRPRAGRRGRGYVDVYHIDTDDGLLLFAETMRRHGLG